MIESTYIDEKEFINNLILNILPEQNNWELKANYITTGKGGTILNFDYMLVSRDESEKIPILLLKGGKNERLDQIASLHLKSKAINATRKIAISSTSCTPYENFLAGIFNVNIIRESSTEQLSLVESERKTRNDIRIAKKTENTIRSQPVVKKKREYNANRKRRDRTKIVHDILELADSNGTLGITKIIYRCNLNYNSAQKIINDLVSRKLIEVMASSGIKKKFRITETGLTFLSDLKKLSFVDR